MASRKYLLSDPDYTHFIYCQTEIDTKYIIEKSFTYQQSILILISINCLKRISFLENNIM